MVAKRCCCSNKIAVSTLGSFSASKQEVSTGLSSLRWCSSSPKGHAALQKYPQKGFLSLDNILGWLKSDIKTYPDSLESRINLGNVGTLEAVE